MCRILIILLCLELYETCIPKKPDMTENCVIGIMRVGARISDKQQNYFSRCHFNKEGLLSNVIVYSYETPPSEPSVSLCVTVAQCNLVFLSLPDPCFRLMCTHLPLYCVYFPVRKQTQEGADQQRLACTAGTFF